MSRRRLRAGTDASGVSIFLSPPDSDSGLSESWVAQSSSAAQRSVHSSRSTTTTVTTTTTHSSSQEQSESVATMDGASIQAARRRTTTALPGNVQDSVTMVRNARRRSDDHYYKGMVLRSGHRLKGLTAEERQRAIAAGILPANHTTELLSGSAAQSLLQTDAVSYPSAELRSSRNHDGSYVVKTVTEEWLHDDELDGDVVELGGSGRRSRREKFEENQGGLLRRSSRRGVVRRDLSEDFEMDKSEQEDMEKGALDAEQSEIGTYGSAYKDQVNNSYSSMYQATEHDFGRDADVSDEEMEDYTSVKRREHRELWFSTFWTRVTELWEMSALEKARMVTNPVQAGAWWLWAVLTKLGGAIRSAGHWLWRLLCAVATFMVAPVWFLGRMVSLAPGAMKRQCLKLWETVAETWTSDSAELTAARSARVTRSSAAQKAGSSSAQTSESSSAKTSESSSAKTSESSSAKTSESSSAEILTSRSAEMSAAGDEQLAGSSSAGVVESCSTFLRRSGGWVSDSVALVTSPVKRGCWWVWEWVLYLSANLLLLDVLLLERSRRRGLCCCLCLPLLLLLPLMGWLFLNSPAGESVYNMYQSSDRYLLAGFLPKSSYSQESWFFSQWKEAPSPPVQEGGEGGGGVVVNQAGGDTRVVYTGLGRQEVEEIVEAALVRNRESVRSEFLALLRDDQDSRVQAQNSLLVKLEAFNTAITAMNEKSESLSAQIAAIKTQATEESKDQRSAASAAVVEMEVRLLALQKEIAALREEQAVTAAQLAALRGETADLKSGLAALAALTRNCCQNETALAASIRPQVLAVLSQISKGEGGDEDDSRSGFLAWLGQHYISRADYEAELGRFADEITRKLAALAKEQAALGETLAASTTIHREADTATTGVVAINEDYIRLMVDEALAKFNADKTGMADYALESAGGSIVSTRCSETYYRKTALVSIFGIPLWYTSNSPRTVIQPEVHPGQCWAFAGPQGYLVVELSGPITPTAFSLEHIPKSLSPTGNINSAPSTFAVLGLADEKDTIGKVLGNYTYSDEGNPIQFFPVQVEDVPPFRFIELRITGNHGNLEYTCLYRFRVHGVPYKEDE